MWNPVLLSATKTAATADSGMAMLVSFLPILAMILLLWLMMRPQSKKRKQEDQMRKNAQIGDDITTIGGICGRIVGIKEDNDTLVVETGTDRAKLRVKRWAIGSVDTIHDAPEEEPKKKRSFFGRSKDEDELSAKAKKKSDSED